MKSNPFTLTFGREPINYIPRPYYFIEVENSFLSETRPNQAYMITGVRGSGKTVLLTTLSKKFNELKDWIVIDINPERDMLESFASKLYNSSKTKHLFVKLGLSLSFGGVGLAIENDKPSEDIETTIDKMMDYLTKNGEKVLITIDDATNNSYIKSFSHMFQSLIRKDYSVFLLMTGLYENISSIQNNKALTFLARIPRLIMKPLNLVAIKDSYRDIFETSDEDSVKMAKLTNGYAYAYQLLGYLFWEKKDKSIDKKLLKDYDVYLAELVYDRLWDSLPEQEQLIIKSISKDCHTGLIMEETNINEKQLSVYRDRLIKRGLVVSKKRGELSFTLPRFKEYVDNKELFV